MILKVKSYTKSTQLAGAIAKCVRNNTDCELHCIGAASINQGIKSIAIANSYLESDQYHISCIPEFIDTRVDNETLSAIKIKITVSDLI